MPQRLYLLMLKLLLQMAALIVDIQQAYGLTAFAVNGDFSPVVATNSCAVVQLNFVDDAITTGKAEWDRTFAFVQTTVDVDVLGLTVAVDHADVAHEDRGFAHVESYGVKLAA